MAQPAAIRRTRRGYPGADLTGLTLLANDGRPTTAVCTVSGTPAVDQAQYDYNDGPCLTAFREMHVVRVPDLVADVRWPHVARHALASGVRSSLSAPLVVHRCGIGALTFYSRSENAFTDDDEGVAELLGLHAGAVLANAQAFWSAHELSRQLEQAMVSRATIEQAKGVLIEQSGVTSDQAFELLKRASQRENRKLREIAAEVVRRAQDRER